MAANHVDTVIVGGQIVTSSQVYESSIAISGEKIVAIGPENYLPPADRYIDASGKFVLPGLIDSHVHLDGHDDYALGSLAAAHAGLTTLVPFGTYQLEGDETLPPGRPPHPRNRRTGRPYRLCLPFHPAESTEHLVRSAQRGRSGRQVVQDVHDLQEAAPAGCATTTTSARRWTWWDVAAGSCSCIAKAATSSSIWKTSSWARATRTPQTFLLRVLTGQKKRQSTGRSRCLPPPAARPTLCTSSTHLGLERIKQAQSLGQRVWTETCPQYLLLSDAQMAERGPLAKIGPPLRPDDGPDRDALWEGLRQGHVSIVASDHSPHPQELKQPGWDNIFVDANGMSVPFGSPGIETIVPLMYSEGVVQRGLPIWWLARVMAENPARIFGIYPRKGVIQVGSDADFLILDPNGDRIVTASDHHSNAGYTLFEGWRVNGRPWITMLRGQVLLQDGEIQQKPGIRDLH